MAADLSKLQCAHTPGPWSVNTGEHCGARIDGPNGRAIAHAIQRDEHPAMGQGISQDVALANARLIAAAPDMLEALRGVIRVADRATVEFDAARAAVANATGMSAAERL